MSGRTEKTTGKPAMSERERVLAVLNYKPYDRLPVIHFGFWDETLDKWLAEGHITAAERRAWGSNNVDGAIIAERLGFDCGWEGALDIANGFAPGFEQRVLEELPDGSRKVINGDGVVVLEKPGLVSIPAEIDHLLKDRASWEEHYLPRLRWSEERGRGGWRRVRTGAREFARVDAGGLERLRAANDTREYLYGLNGGSLFGMIRNWLGVEGSCYLLADDEELFDEIVNAFGELCYRCVEATLASGAQFDYLHFWEDICFKNGPLISPTVFAEKVGPHYRRITELARAHGIGLTSVDCDGCIDALLPIWLENGVNVMFPIEVGTWEASLAPWRAKYGRELRGVGGMNKNAFARGRAAVDAEIERLRPLVELGGYIPCPDHRIAPDAEWENVRYYCERIREEF